MPTREDSLSSAKPWQVAVVRDELELKMKVLALPLDICVSAAVRGQTSLQGVLDVALKVLQDIERFEDTLRQQTLSKVHLNACRLQGSVLLLITAHGVIHGRPAPDSHCHHHDDMACGLRTCSCTEVFL